MISVEQITSSGGKVRFPNGAWVSQQAPVCIAGDADYDIQFEAVVIIRGHRIRIRANCETGHISLQACDGNGLVQCRVARNGRVI